MIIPFIDPVIVGRFVFHCQVIKHEDKSMMMTVEVVRWGEAPAVTAPRVGLL